VIYFTGVVEQVISDVSGLKKLKVSGYIQAQWQKADTIGSLGKYAGGDFKGLDNRFMVRRGRIKFAYTNELSQYVLQFDVTEKGMGIKDAYAMFTDPWLQTLSLTAGAFNRPFGYEIEYSSSSRETPERSRIFQTLFNQERDLGAKLTIQAPKTSQWNFLKLDLGLISGNGLNPETDKYKDFIGHLYANKTFLDENLNIGVGASIYNGGWASQTTNVYKMNGTSFAAETVKKGDQVKRQYLGLEAQVSLNSAIGITTLRGEYLWGTQPGIKGATDSPTGIQTASTTTNVVLRDTLGKVNTISNTTTANSDAYLRNFSGGYIYFVQNILQSKHEFVVKYDWYDPNTKISGNQIGVAGSNTGAADIKYSTLGLGWIYHWNSNVKITVYYDMVKNETTPNIINSDFTKDFTKDQKDNIWTIRVQYKF
jgi:hypothetical protein